jgi:hypothetical protein
MNPFLRGDDGADRELGAGMEIRLTYSVYDSWKGMRSG